jgi:hypothetical protein
VSLITHFVIPAKAGIQSSGKNMLKPVWGPTFVGMTLVRNPGR